MLPLLPFEEMCFLILASLDVLQFPLQLEVAAVTLFVERTIVDGTPDGATRFVAVTTVIEPALFRKDFDVVEGAFQAFFIAPELQLPHAGCVDDHAAFRQDNQLTTGGCVPSSAVVFADIMDQLPFRAENRVDETRFADA